MDMTLEQYILNPMGKSNAVLNATAREAIRSNYIKKFDAILLRENGKINYTFYYDSKKNEYWAHVKVPSEVVPKFYYDVVLKFYTNAKVSAGGENLNKYFVKFFSNDPAFVYTYAYVFAHNNLLVTELSPKMSKRALKKAPVEKNPTKNVGYVKAIYFAFLFLSQRGLLNITRVKAESKPLDIRKLLSSIEDADTVIAKRQEEGERIEKKRKTPSEVKTIPGPGINTDERSKFGKIQKTKTVGSVGGKGIGKSMFSKITPKTKRK